MEKAYFARHLISLIKGKYDASNLEYVCSHMKCREGVRYVEIQMAESGNEEDISDQEMREFQRSMYESCIAYLKEYALNCVFDMSADEKIYDVGLIFFAYMAQEADLSEKEYLKELLDYLNENLTRPVIMLVGKQVSDISNIARSYGNACILRSFQGFRAKKDIYIYEEEVHVSADGMVLCKKSLDELLKVVEQNNHIEIRAAVDRFYEEMGQRGIHGESMTLNINYMAAEILQGKTILEALNTDLVCDAINTAMRELFLQIVYGRTQSAFSDDGLAIGAGLEDLGKGLRSQVGTMYATKEKGVRYLEMAEGYVTGIALDENNEVIGYQFVSLGKMTDFIKKGDDPNTAWEKAKGQYGRVADAVKIIDPREE